MIEETPDIGVENPVHAHGIDANRKRIERMVLTAPWPEPIREPEEILLVDRVENSDHGTLEDFILQSGYTQRSLSAIRLRYEPPPNRLRPVAAAMDPAMQILKIGLQVCLVVLPCQTIHPGRSLTLKRLECLPQQIDGDMVQQCGERLLLPLPCSVPYTVQPR